MGNFGGSAYAMTAIPSNMGGVAEATPPEKATSLRCVLVHASGDPIPARLKQAMQSKRIAIEPTTDIYAALVAICRMSRDDSIALPILAFVEPVGIPHAADLVEAAAVYAPRAVHWTYGASPRDQIREVREDDLSAWRAEQGELSGRTDSGGVPGAHAASTTSHSVHSGDPVDGGPPVGQTSPGSGGQPGSVLTDEELDMLLSDEDPHGSNGA